MKRKLFVISCLLILVLPLISNAEDKNEYEIGDIKCPANAKNCTSDKNTAVVTETMGNYKVTKTVSKTKNLGEYEVKFHVDGDNKEKTIVEEDAYIVVIFDKSGSLSGSIGKAKDGVKNFFDKFSKKDNFHLALVVFADWIASSGNFSKSPNLSLIDSNVGSNSHIEIALYEANELLKTAPENSQKYIVVFGDGQYWCRPGMCSSDHATCNSANYTTGVCRGSKYTYYEDQLDRISKISNLKKYAILYKSTSVNNVAKDYEYIKKITTDYKDARENTNYIEYFNAIANDIDNVQKEKVKNVTALLTDNVGSNFTVEKKSKEIKYKIENTPVDLKSFKININKSTKELWNETNSNFTLTVGEKKYTSKVNPLVYWNRKQSIESCSDTSQIKDSNAIGNKYYTIICENEYKVDLAINNLSPKTTSFNIHNGSGFPVNVALNSKLKCTYEFYKDTFEDDYKKYESDYKNAEKSNDKHEMASIQKKIDKMLDDINNNYVKKVNNLINMNDYKTKVENQEVQLLVTYKDASQSVLLENNGNVNSDMQCDTNNPNLNVKGTNTYSKRICTSSIQKNMQLPITCLSMNTFESEDCVSNSSTQLLGGNNFYIKRNSESGYVSIFIKNASYFNDDFNLEGNKKNDDNSYKCQFTTSISSPIYRQIELTDPFVQTYTNKKRTIGKNWLNDSRKYNFVKIIDPEIWNKTFEYQYSMSKVDVEEIKKDTSQEGVSSYLGKDCSFNNKNEYICTFVRRSTGNNGKSNYFTNIIVNK